MLRRFHFPCFQLQEEQHQATGASLLRKQLQSTVVLLYIIYNYAKYIFTFRNMVPFLTITSHVWFLSNSASAYCYYTRGHSNWEAYAYVHARMARVLFWALFIIQRVRVCRLDPCRYFEIIRCTNNNALCPSGVKIDPGTLTKVKW